MAVKPYNRYNLQGVFFHHPTDISPKNSDFAMHVQDQYEIFYFVSGSASFIVETTSYPLTPHTLLIMRPMESHRINILSNAPYERYVVQFSAAVLDDIDPQRRLCKPFDERRLGENNIFYADEFEIHPLSFFKSMDKGGLSAEAARLNILINLFPLLGQISCACTDKKHNLYSYKNSRIAEIANYINEHLFDKISVESLAEHFFISSSQLSRRFKQATGSPLWEYIINKRLVAVQKLTGEGESVSSACLKCGFSDYSSFYRSYVKRFGAAPKKDCDKRNIT